MTETEEEIMLQIQNTLVSLDLAERFFVAISMHATENAASKEMQEPPITENEKKRARTASPGDK